LRSELLSQEQAAVDVPTQSEHAEEAEKKRPTTQVSPERPRPPPKSTA